MSRLPPVDDATARELFQSITESRGWVSNLLRSLAHAPEGLARFQAVGHYGRYMTELTERERELVICITGRNVGYAWAHHAPLAAQVGITEAQLAALKEGKVPEGLSDAEAALCAYTFDFCALGGIGDEVLARMQEHYSSRQITDVSLTAAYYMAAGSIIIGLGVETEPPEVLKIELDWQREKATG